VHACEYHIVLAASAGYVSGVALLRCRNTIAGLPRDASLLRKLLSEPRQTADGYVWSPGFVSSV
jgi:hypothetical protein